MIYFSLPEFHFNYKDLMSFFRLPKNIMKAEVAFSMIEGNLPYTYWNGGYINNNFGDLILYDSIQSMFSAYGNYRLCFNCSNIYLQEDDFEDTYMNLLLSIGENGANCISVSNLHLYEFLKERYKNYAFKLSNDFDLILTMTPEIINALPEFDLIQIPVHKVNDMDFLKQIKNKKNIEIPVNSLCGTSCIQFRECAYQNQQNQYNFSANNICLGCPKRPLYHKQPPLITLEDIVDIYQPLGFSNFSIAPIVGDNLLTFLIDYFVKDEFKAEAFRIVGEMI